MVPRPMIPQLRLGAVPRTRAGTPCQAPAIKASDAAGSTAASLPARETLKR